MDKHSSGLLLSQKAILDVLWQQVDLGYGWPPCRKPACPVGAMGRLLVWLDESLEDFKGDTQQRHGR